MWVRGERHAPAALLPRKRLGSRLTGGWVGPRAGLEGWGKSCPHRDSIPGPPSPWRVAILTTLPQLTREICGGWSGIRASFPQRTSIFPCQYHSTDDRHRQFQTCASRIPRIGDQFPGDPWMHFCNGYFEVCLFYIIKWIMLWWNRGTSLIGDRFIYFVWPSEYVIKESPVPTKSATIILIKVKSCNASGMY